MVPCQRCGATLDPAAVSCPYCGTRTLHAVALEQQRAAQSWQAEQSAHAARTQKAEQEISKQATIGLVATALGFFCFCAPVSIVGIVLSLRAKTTARQYGLIAPATATIGVVLGACGALFTTGIWIAAFLTPPEKETRAATSTTSTSVSTEDAKTTADVAESVSRPQQTSPAPSSTRPSRVRR